MYQAIPHQAAYTDFGLCLAGSMNAGSLGMYDLDMMPFVASCHLAVSKHIQAFVLSGHLLLSSAKRPGLACFDNVHTCLLHTQILVQLDWKVLGFRILGI